MKTGFWDRMLLKTKPKPNTSSCKNTTTKEHFIRIRMILFSKGTSTYQLQWKCRTSQRFLLFFRKGKEISERKVNQNTRTLQLKIRLIRILWPDQMKACWTVGRKNWQATKSEPSALYFDQLFHNFIMFSLSNCRRSLWFSWNTFSFKFMWSVRLMIILTNKKKIGSQKHKLY